MDLILHKKLLTLQAENAMLREEIQKLQELMRPETIKNPQQYGKRIGQLAAIAADRTVSQKPGAVEAKKALQIKGVGTDNDTFANLEWISFWWS